MTGAIAGDEIYVVGRGPRPEARPEHVPERLSRWLGVTIVIRVPVLGD